MGDAEPARPSHTSDPAPSPDENRRSKRAKLSEAQLRRKREVDREAQRAVRERQKNHVTHLESLVKALSGDPDGRIQRLMTQLEESKAETSRLRETLNNITRLARNVNNTAVEKVEPETPIPTLLESTPDLPSDVAPDTTYSDRQRPIASRSLPVPLRNQFSAPERSRHSESTFLPPPWKTESSQRSNASSITDGTSQDATQTPPSQSRPSNITRTPSNHPESIGQMFAEMWPKLPSEGRMPILASNLLRHILASDSNTMTNIPNDDDIAIRAVFDGWPAVTSRYSLDLGWQWIREMDHCSYLDWPIPARLAIIREDRLVYLRMLDPNSGWERQHPPCFIPTPVQQSTAHNPLINFYPWPRLRNAMILQPDKFATTKFSVAMKDHLEFIWPYDSHDLYQQNAYTGRYSYSRTLIRHTMELGCYAMKRDFFTIFPDLWDAVACSQPSPVSMISQLSPDTALRRKRPYSQSEKQMLSGNDADGETPTNAREYHQRPQNPFPVFDYNPTPSPRTPATPPGVAGTRSAGAPISATTTPATVAAAASAPAAPPLAPFTTSRNYLLPEPWK